MRDTFDNELRSLLSGYERRVPETVWDGVQHALARRRLAARRRRVWQVAAAVVAIVGLAIMGGRNPFPRKETLALHTQESRNSTKQELRRSTGGACHVAHETAQERDAVTFARERIPAPHTRERIARSREDAAPARPHDVRPSSSPRLLALSVSGNGFPAASSQTGGGAMMSADAPTPHADLAGAPERFSLQNAEPLTTARHHTPLRYGLAVRYGLTPRLAIESGVTLSVLRSTFTVVPSQYAYDQHAYYIGVPVMAALDIVRYHGLSVYGTAGAEVAKCVAASDDLGSSLPQPWQLTLRAAAGVAYALTPRLALYAEPGLDWRLDDGSSLRTAFSDRRLAFSLSFGLRVNVR